MEVKLNLKRTFFVCLALFVVFSFSNCEIGLGNAVDTQPPVVAITSPGKGAIIRNTFTLSGTTSDETYVDSVSVLLTATGENAKSYGPFAASVDKTKGTWQVVLNQKTDNKFPIPDGEYGVTVTSKDSASRTSVAESLFTIDNTAPVVVIKSPSRASAFGRTIKVTGDISDSSNLAALYFTAYRKKDDGSLEKIGETQKFANISGVGLELVVGKYFESDQEDGYDATLAAVYDSFYGSTGNGTSDEIYCVIEVEDSAKEYGNPNSARAVESLSGVSGNISNQYYLYSEIYATVYSSGGLGLSNQDLVKVMNGTHPSEETISKAKTVLAEHSIPSATPEADKITMFTLNPANNPTFDVGGYSVKESGGVSVYSDISNETSINITVSPGPDGIELDMQSVKVVLVDQSNQSEVEIFDYASDATPDNIKEIDSSRTITVSIGSQSSGSTYKVQVKGSDVEGNDIFANNANGYGFRIISNNKPPAMNVTGGPANNGVVSSLDNIEYEGVVTLFAENGVPNLSLQVSVTDSNGNTVSGFEQVLIPESKINVDSNGNWTAKIDQSCFTGSLGKDLYTVTLAFTPKDTAHSETGADIMRYLNLDTAPPQVTISTISPLVDDKKRNDNVNGKIKVQGTVSDNYTLQTTDGIEYKLYVANPDGSFPSEPEDSGVLDAHASFVIEDIDTTIFADNRELKIAVTAKDSAGNICTPVEKIVYINQATDLPTVEYSNMKKDTTNLFGMGSWTVYGTATDDDGLKSVKIQFDSAGNDTTSAIEIYTESSLAGTTSQSLSYAVPEANRTSGSHNLRFILVDIFGKESVTEPMEFVVDNDAPVLTITSPTEEFASQNVTVRGTASDSSGISKVEFVSLRKKGSETNEVLSNVPTVTTTDGYQNWNCEVRLATVDSSAEYVQTYLVTDTHGRTAEATVSYKVDYTSPELSAVTVVTGATEQNYSNGVSVNKWFTQPALTLKGTITEPNLKSITMSYSEQNGAPAKSVSVTPTNDFSVTESFNFEGKRDITFLIEDKAGNSSTFIVKDLAIDSIAPSVSQTNLSTTITSVDFNLDFTVTDDTSGLKEYYVGSRSGFDAQDSVVTGTLGAVSNSVTVPINKLTEGNNTLYLRVLDSAGNVTSDIELGSITKDTEAPEVAYTTPVAHATVNKTIELTGSVIDQNLPLDASPSLWIKNSSGVWQDITASVQAEKIGTSWEISEFDTMEFTHLDGSPITTYDSNATMAGVQLMLQVRFTDEAGNTTLGDTESLVVTADQNADRPLIKLNSVKTTEVTTIKDTMLAGTISDDDGEISELYIQVVKEDESFSDSAWQLLVPTGGNWTYSLTGTDGSYTAYFKVKDSVSDEYFVIDLTNADSLKKPYLQYQSDTKTDSVLHFALDMNPPTITDLQVDKNDGNGYQPVTPNMVFGGTNKNLNFQVSVQDGVTTSEDLIVTLGGLGDIELVNSSGNLFTGSVNVENISSGSINLVVSAKDKAGYTVQAPTQIIVDNSAPNSITNVVPNKDTEVTGVVNLSGLVADENYGNSGVESVQYAIPEYGVTENNASTLTYEDVTFNTATWSIELDSLGDLTKSNDYTGYESGGLYELPVWFKVTDKAGNVGYITNAASIKYNPDADKPKVEITYPTHDQTDVVADFNYVIMGGTIRITGTADDNEGIDSVWLQFDMDGDGTFENGAGAIGSAIATEPIPGLTEEGARANGTRSWSYSLDVSKFGNELNYAISGKTLDVRVVAVDNDKSTQTSQLTGVWSSVLHISVNNNVPSFNDIMLKRFGADGEVVAEMEYSDDMYIKGSDWYLTGTIEDSDGLARVSVAGEAVNDLTVASQRYEMKVPIQRADNGSGEWNVTIVADDQGEPQQTSSQGYTINIDNTAPVFADGANEDDLVLFKNAYGEENNKISTTNSVQNSNNWFSVSGKVTEEGSGFDKLVFYFKRTGEDGNRIYNVMEFYGENRKENRTDITVANATEGQVYINEDGLPVLYTATVERGIETSSDTLTYAGVSGNDNIRKGGLVKIGGVYRSITDVSGGTVTFTPSCSTEFKEAEFVYGMVVDRSSEKQNNDGSESENSDGDGMVESYQKTSNSYTWDASVKSNNIPDGPIEIHVVVFDVAGNSRHGFVESNVSNNRPRITSVKLGTDLSGNGSFEDYEYDEFFVNLNSDGTGNTAYGIEIWDLDTASWKEGVSAWTVKNKLSVIPKFVGGTAPMHYIFSKDVNGEKLTEAATSQSPVEFTESFVIENNVLGTEGEDASNVYRFSFWDSTEETSPGTDSQWTVLNATFKQDLTDDVAPTAVIDPLYWKSKDDNSLYENSRENGHIELSDDLLNTFNAANGVMDGDDKVSGKITFRGEAYDDVRLSSLWVSFGNFAFNNYVTNAGYGTNGVSGTLRQVAFFDTSSNTWVVPTATMAQDGWEFNIDKVVDADGNETDEYTGYFDQKGHQVEWTLSIDTSRIPTVAIADVKIIVAAVDHVNSSEQIANQNIQLDVVPYITGVETSLSKLKVNNPSVYNRTALGNYPVYENETVTISGFNLSGTSITITDSGEYSYVVNGISSLNNRNNNDAKGSFTGELSQDNYEDYAYNRQPNGDNNNLLTDDILFNVWQINSEAIPAISGRIEQPVMKINPLDGQITFAFKNGPLYFSMGGYNSTSYNNSTAYDYWAASYDMFTSIGYTVDALGNSYGVAAGGDINENEADNFCLWTSRWGTGQRSSRGSYDGSKALRLEKIAQKNNGVNDFLKNRIYSPAMATAVHDDATDLYMIYYDDMNSEIRFRAGRTNSTEKTNFGNFVDECTSSNPQNYSINNTVVLSDSTYCAGEYASVAVVSSEGATVDDTVVVVWYDATNLKLWYSYKTYTDANQLTGNVTKGQNGWQNAGFSQPIAVFGDMSNVGEYCKIAVDKLGGIHVAAYDGSNANLMYAYQSTYNSGNFNYCVVDSESIVGTEITLDVGLDSTGTLAIPYIGYYMTSAVKPKQAYLVKGIDRNNVDLIAGASSDVFTGAWEVSLIPTSSIVPNDHINIGVWKDNNGKVINSSTSSSLSRNEPLHNGTTNGYNSTSWGYCYGNGTANPVVSYQIKISTSGFIETAQMK
ncbi:MAG: hypothetical protein J6B81_01570 [Spirochaetaceae bacterium]|nr:hypothetical protein [Spirochaetaceae bacterium]